MSTTTLNPVTLVDKPLQTAAALRSTPAQHTAIFGLGRWLNRDVRILCAAWYRRRPVDLSRSMADEFIGRLKGLKPVRQTEAR
jgi:hypothetical protein